VIDMTTVGELAQFIDRFALKSLAESWDNVGLLIGDRAAEVSRVMTCLTVTPASAREAIDRKVQLIVTHHPVLFRPVQRLTADEPQGRVLLDLIRAGVAVYSPHTAFDGTAGGINEMLADRIGLSGCRPLRPGANAERVKMVVFVPPSDLEKVGRALFDAGAGVIGEYRECSFRVAGRGTFFGSEASHPTVGQAGRREEVDEWRLEVVCPSSAAARIVAAMRAAHSYEEPAYDIYPLASEPGPTGAGRCGELRNSTSLEAFAAAVGTALGSPLVQVVGPRDRLIQRVAVTCGSGSEFLSDAAAHDCDALVTGEASFHRMLEAEATGIALVLAGHYATERFAVERLAEKLSGEIATLEVWASTTEREPAWVSK
jgi:dinuclear metal center YbgI/SA1388 family protein